MKWTLKISGIITILLLFTATTFRSDSSKYFEITKNIEIFANLYKELNTYYVDDLDPGKLMRTGIDAMVESLDPYTNYISESDIEGYRYMTEGRYHGIGAVSKKIGDYVTITELYQGQPADKAGLRVGDQIIAVDGNDAKGKSTEEVNKILQGFPGTEVELTIRRPGEAGDFNIDLVRDEVSVENVPYFGMVADQIGYVALTTFTREAGRNVANAIRELKKENPELKGVIFDLRNNGGGLLSEAVNICNIFIPKGELVVTTKGKVKEWDRSFNTLNNSLDEDIPLVVLVNNYSASASEIVCGVMQDYDRGVLIGQRTYGKGLVQNTRDVGYNAKVKMTTAKYYIPSGRCIQSVEYNNGEPVDISDDRRTPFQTRNGRTVLDGGGVKPDIILDKISDDAIIKALLDQDLIFKYATEYCQDNPEPTEIEDFHFHDFDGFVNFLKEMDFSFETESEGLLRRLEKTAGEEGYKLTTDIEALQKRIQEEKKIAVSQYKHEIIDLIEKEIAGRYFYQKGRIQMRLRNDKEIDEAVKVLSDPARYQGILAGE
jgi:carboxyl-terminal processing protease